MKKNYAFIDRDGTIIVEPPITKQVSSLEELELIPFAISSLKQIQDAGYTIIIVSNQDALGTPANPTDTYKKINTKLLQILASEGVTIQRVLTCPHTSAEQCACRKPKIGLVDSLIENINKEKSFMVGDRKSDVEFAENVGIRGFLLDQQSTTWKKLAQACTRTAQRTASIRRTTNETDIECTINIDADGKSTITTGLAFFDHMLDQLAKHGRLDIKLKAHRNDLGVDEHHLIEDTAIVIGQAILKALQTKKGIERYSHERLAPMDEAIAYVAIDLSGRPYLQYSASFTRERVGDFPTEMLKHFFYSLAMESRSTIHVRIDGENTHHQIEAAFKALGKCLHDATRITHSSISSTKGTL